MTESYLPAGTARLALFDVRGKIWVRARLTLNHLVAVLGEVPHAVLHPEGRFRFLTGTALPPLVGTGVTSARVYVRAVRAVPLGRRTRFATPAVGFVVGGAPQELEQVKWRWSMGPTAEYQEGVRSLELRLANVGCISDAVKAAIGVMSRTALPPHQADVLSGRTSLAPCSSGPNEGQR